MISYISTLKYELCLSKKKQVDKIFYYLIEVQSDCKHRASLSITPMNKMIVWPEVRHYTVNMAK